MLLQIERVDQVADPVVKQGKRGPYTVYEFMCSGWLDGGYAGQIKVQTLAGKEADYVQEGWAGQVTVDETFSVHYKIETPANGVDGQGKAQGLQPVRNSQQAQAPSPAPAQGAPPPPPGAPASQPYSNAGPPAPAAQGKKVVFMDLMAGYTTCLQAAEYITAGDGYDCAFCDLHAVACTLFIQAQRGGVKIPAPRESGAAQPQGATARAAQPAPAAPEPEAVVDPDDDNLPF